MLLCNCAQDNTGLNKGLEKYTEGKGKTLFALNHYTFIQKCLFYLVTQQWEVPALC